MAPRPSTSTYCVLGLLAIRPWTAYELAQQVERSLALLWPSSVRTIYNEPKRLQELGWATAREREELGRAATEYRITRAGRRALESWLASPPEEPALSYEGLLRVLFADQGSVDDLVAAVRASAEQWRQRVDETMPQVREYLEDGGPFPDRIHLIALVGRFIDAYSTLVEQFASEVETEAAGWGTTRGVGRTPAAEAVISEILERRDRKG